MHALAIAFMIFMVRNTPDLKFFFLHWQLHSVTDPMATSTMCSCFVNGLVVVLLMPLSCH